MRLGSDDTIGTFFIGKSVVFRSVALETDGCSEHHTERWREPTGVVEATADLHRSHLAVEPHRAGGVGGDLTGVLLPALATAVWRQCVCVWGGGGKGPSRGV